MSGGDGSAGGAGGRFGPECCNFLIASTGTLVACTIRVRLLCWWDAGRRLSTRCTPAGDRRLQAVLIILQLPQTQRQLQ